MTSATRGNPAASDGEDGDPRARADAPSPTALLLCVAIAFAQGLWSLFQWTQLVAARTGGDAFCGLVGDAGEPGPAAACAAVWDTDVATAVQTVSGLPIAGWGVVFGLVASGLPLFALWQRARRRAAEDTGAERSRVWPATVVTALGGVAAATVLAISAPRELARCGACMLSAALALSYALVAWLESPRGVAASLPRGVSLASGALALAYVLLFVPGLRTPRASEVANPYARELTPQETARRDASRAGEITALLQQLRGARRRVFVRALSDHREAPVVSLPEIRAPWGAPNAPVRITQFTSLHCPECAALFSTLRRLRTSAPPRSFSIESRYYPLDRNCNDRFGGGERSTIRCAAALAQICLAGHPDAEDFAANLYRRMRILDEEGIYELAAPMMSREDLAACIASPETARALQQDVDLAGPLEPDDLPLVLLNGRPVAPLGPLVYALILAGGDPFHPAFDAWMATAGPAASAGGSDTDDEPDADAAETDGAPVVAPDGDSAEDASGPSE